MLNYSSRLRLVAVSFALSCSLVCASTASAQSGRRVHKPAPTPASTPEVKPTATKPAEKEKATLKFIVGVDRYLGFSTIPLYYYDSVARGCAERLDDAPGVKVEVASREMSRSDAVLRAKAEKVAFVVWLQLKVENVSGDPSSVDNLNQIYIEYEVFEPTTAKRLTWGHAYQQGYRKGGVVVNRPGSGRGNPSYSEYLLKQAAKEAADRILNALKIDVTSGDFAGND
jgi:hypothetical protein